MDNQRNSKPVPKSGTEYIQERRIPELFECLTASLVHNRPEEHIDFLLACLSRAAQIGPENVFWDTFLPPMPQLCADKDAGQVFEQKTSGMIHTENGQANSPATDNEEFTEVKKNVTVNLLKLYNGGLDDVPKIPTNTVRVFLSSTFSDFRAERNILPKQAYPELQKFCRDRGLDFQVIDMRWGVTDEMLNDHLVTELCISEIKHCQQVSCGPNFATLLGDRYGYQPFPATIEKLEFDTLTAQFEKDDPCKELVLTWFKEDTNDVPSSFILQPVTSLLPHFNDGVNEEKRKQDQSEWAHINEQLRISLSKLAQEAYNKGLITENTLANYTSSVTEHEVKYGVLHAAHSKKNALCYLRYLDGLESFLDRKNTGRFVDTSSTANKERNKLEIEENPLSKLTLLKEKVKEQVPNSNIFRIDWTGVNIEESTEQCHLDYLQAFCKQFVSDMKAKIEESMASRSTVNSLSINDIKLYQEIVHHAQFAKTKVEIYCGRNEELQQVKSLLVTPDGSNIPIAIHAPSGHGKTSFLAMCSKHAKAWLGEDTCVVIRFLGTSAESSNILNTLVSAIKQIRVAFDLSSSQEEVLDNMMDVKRCFEEILITVGNLPSKKSLVILLDSIDQLSDTYGAYRLSWLPKLLPKNVFIIISVITHYENILDTCSKNRKCKIMELKQLSQSTASDIIDTFLAKKNRRLTNEQQEHVINAFEKCAQPLFLKLMLDKAVKWNSFTSVASVKIPEGVRQAIDMMFRDLEVKYGEMFVRRSFSYLTCGNGGLSDVEMDDVLSCDDDVLNEVYKYHDPPLEGIIRIPSLLWARLGHEVGEYLSEKQVDGKPIRTWYHRQFIEAAENRYLSDKPHLLATHSLLAKIYQQSEGIKKSITLRQRRGLTLQDADRRVTPQPLSVSNLRKLNSLPFHFLHSQGYETLIVECIMNFDFLFTKIKSVGISALLREIKGLSKAIGDSSEVQLLQKFLEMTYDAFLLDNNLLPVYATIRLADYAENPNYPRLGIFVKCATEWMKETDIPVLIPKNQLNITPLESAMKFTQKLGNTCQISTNEEVIVCSWKEPHSVRNVINVFDLKNRETLASFEMEEDSLIRYIQITPNNQYFFAINDGQLHMYELYTGDRVANVDILMGRYESVFVSSMTLSSEGKWLVFSTKTGKPSHLAKSDSWKIEAKVFCVETITIDHHKPNILTVDINPKRLVEKLIFIQDNCYIVAVKRDSLSVFTVPDLEEKHVQTVVRGNIACAFVECMQESKSMIGPIEHEDGCNLFILNFERKSMTFTSKFHCKKTGDSGGRPSVFGLAIDAESSRALVGTSSSGKAIDSHLWTVDIEKGNITSIEIAKEHRYLPVEMSVFGNFRHAVIGFKSGQLSIVDIQEMCEIRHIQAHSSSLWCIRFCDKNETLLSMAVDNCLKLWNVDKILSDNAEESKSKNEQYTKLDNNQQVLEMATNSRDVVTISDQTEQGPQFWKLDTSVQNKEITDTHHVSYSQVLKQCPEIDEPNYHGSIELVDNFVILKRNKFNSFLLYVAETYGDCKALGHEYFDDGYFTFAIGGNANRSPMMLVVREGLFDKRHLPSLKLEAQVKIPCISDAIPNIDTKKGKQAIINYKLGVTTDNKYFLLINSSPLSKVGKHIDWIDIENMEYKARIDLPSQSSWKLKVESFCYFVVSSDGPTILRPSQLAMLESEVQYCCAINGGLYHKGILSDDNTLGLEMTADYCINVWNVDPCKHLLTLQGHTSDISTTAISIDKTLIASGSFDNTVRLWSVKTGQMLCLFHMYGNVANVYISPDKQCIIAKYYAAPGQMRGAILKIENVKN